MGKRYSKKSTLKNKILEINIERTLLTSFILLFILLIISQIALTNPFIRAEIFINEEIEGTPLKSEEFLYKQGELTFKSLGKGNKQDAKILVNGDEKAAFLEDEITIKVRDGDIIEIDGSESPDYIDILIISKSDNIKTDCLGQKFRIKSQVKKIIQVKIE